MDDLKKIQKKARKQSRKKGYWGWFQNQNAGNVPINNAIFNSMMDASDIAGAGEADGGIGMTGAVGEGLENTKEGNVMPDQVKFYYCSSQEDPDQKWYQQEVDQVVVDKEDVINALCYLLAYDPEFIEMSPEELHNHVALNWQELKDEFTAELFDIFSHKLDGTFEEDNFTDQFYQDDEVQCDCEQSQDEYEEDPYLTQYMFDDIDSEDPRIPVTEYEIIRTPYSLNESVDGPVIDLDALLNQAYEFGYQYGFEGEPAFDRFMRRVKVSLSDEEKDQLRAAFDNGNHEGEMYDDAHDYMGELDECSQSKVVESGYYKRPTNPYDDDVDSSYDFDDDYEEADIDVNYHDASEDELRKMGAFDNLNDEAEDEFEYNDEPLEESAMSELDLELQDPDYIDRLQKNIDALEGELRFLINQAPKEIRRGGAFDSQEEIDDAIKATERELNRSKAKMAIIRRMDA